MGLAGASEYIVTSTVRAAHRNAALAGFAGCSTGATGATGSTGGCPTGPTHTTTPPPGGGAGGPLADLAITKSVSPDSVDVGGTATFTLTVTNNGPDPATSVVVTDPIPDGLGITGSPPT